MSQTDFKLTGNPEVDSALTKVHGAVEGLGELMAIQERKLMEILKGKSKEEAIKMAEALEKILPGISKQVKEGNIIFSEIRKESIKRNGR